MELTPGYDGAPILTMTGDPASIRAPFLRQRRRLVEALSTLDDQAWIAPSRCEAWNVQDVMTHLLSTDPFWTASLRSGLAGAPTRMLLGFDPDATPAALVDAADDVAPADTLRAFDAATTELCALVTSLGDDDFDTVAEAPPGHVSVAAVLHHALWDCWVHERDIFVPLGLAPDPEPDEVRHCLRYGAALNAAFAVVYGSAESTGTLTVDVHDPDDTFHVVIDGAVAVADGPAPDARAQLRGAAIDVLEGLSVRQDIDHDLGADAWMVAGLRAAFSPG